MNYLMSMSRLLQFDMAPVNKFNIKGRQYICMANITILGLLYGLSAAFFSQNFLIQQGVPADTVNLIKIIIAGLPVAFLMHGAAALFIWVFLKAVGGKANFMMAYFDMGVAAIALWPLAPVTAALQVGIRAPWLLAAGGCLALYGFAVNLTMLKKTFGLSLTKLMIAASATVIYIGCFMYLWM